MKNPLNSMRLWLENLKESLPADSDVSLQAVRVLDNEIDRLDRVVKRFLDFTRPVEMHMEDISLAEVLSSVIELARPQIERANVTVKMKLATDLPAMRGDRELLRQAVLNLVLNAVEAMTGWRAIGHPTGEGRGQCRDPTWAIPAKEFRRSNARAYSSSFSQHARAEAVSAWRPRSGLCNCIMVR